MSSSVSRIVGEGENSSTTANKMKITCVITIILGFLAWETAGWECFGKTYRDCMRTHKQEYGYGSHCSWHTVWKFIGYCYKPEDEDKIFLRGGYGYAQGRKKNK